MTLCINLAIRFFSWLTLSLLANRMSTLSTGPPLIKRTPPQFPLKLDKNNESFYEPRLSSFVESGMLPKGGGCAPAPGLQGGGGCCSWNSTPLSAKATLGPTCPTREHTRFYPQRHAQFSGAVSSLHRREYTAHDVSMQYFNTAAARRSKHHHCCSFSLHSAKLLKSSLVFFTQQNVDARERKEIARKFNKCLIYFLQDMKKKLNIDRDKDNRSITVATAQ